jgi:hypothetical protein
MKIEQPKTLSLFLMLLPDVTIGRGAPARSFPDHVGAFKYLTNVTFLIDEPRTNPYFCEYGVTQEQCMVSRCIEAVCLSAAPVHTLVAGAPLHKCLQIADADQSMHV